jgi:glycosyltransferase involved in cell wall biosynthesis
MRLDVILATRDRDHLLSRAVDSLFEAPIPEGLEVQVTVVDNGSRDRTREIVEERSRREKKLHYLFEARPGQALAQNTAIAATTGDLVGFIDDDECVDRNWFRRIYRAFQDDPSLDFIGGPYLPDSADLLPWWLPKEHAAAVGSIDFGNEIKPYTADFPGMLAGGNAVMTRTVLMKVGVFRTDVGPGANGSRLRLSYADEDLYNRLLAAGARGLYLPDLIIYHYVFPERLTKKYIRAWTFGVGVSVGIVDRAESPELARILGIPRYLYRKGATHLLLACLEFLKRRSAESFDHELFLWNLAGIFYGRHFYKSPIPESYAPE